MRIMWRNARAISAPMVLTVCFVAVYTAGVLSAHAAQVACPSQNFETFLQAFARNAETQQAFTAKQLLFEYIDSEAQPEPVDKTAVLDAAQLEFPVMPTLEQMAAEKLEMTTTSLTAGEAEVKIFAPNSDYQLRFGFRKEACWLLVRKADDSI